MVYLLIDLLFMGTVLDRVFDFYENFKSIAAIKKNILNGFAHIYGFVDVIERI